MDLVIFLVLQVTFRFMGCLVKATALVSVCICTVRLRCFGCSSLKKRLHCLLRNVWWEYLKNTNGELVSSEITKVHRFSNKKISFGVIFQGLWPKRNEYLFYKTFLWSVFVSKFHWFFRSFNFYIHFIFTFRTTNKKFLTSNF